MSAIAGIFNLDGRPVDPGALELLTGAMQAHGPDGTHHYRAGPVALGHCLLRSTAQTAGVRQPLVSPDGGFVVVFDGRLDNRAELASRLRICDEPAASDAQIVLAAYREWGRGCPAKLDGEYVFALWEAAERRLFLAKDPVGARQVYYNTFANRFAFASFDEALLCLPGVSREPCDELVAGFLVPEFDDYHAEQAWLEAARALKPAHSLCVSPAGLGAQQRYWSFELKEERAFSSEDECAAALREVFSVAIGNRVRGVTEPATLLSGGVDSASILATLESSLPAASPQVHTFSVLLEPVAGSLESRAIASMTADKRVRAHLLRIPSFTGPVGFQDLMDMVWAHAHPVDNSLLLPAMLCLAAQRAGQRSMLHGASGDIALTALHNYIAPVLQAGQWRTAWRECRAASKHHIYLMGESPLRLLLRNAWSAFVPNRVRRRVRAARVRRLQAPLELGWIHPDFARRLRLVERIRASQSRAATAPDTHYRAEHAQRIFEFPGVASGLAGFQRVGSRYSVELHDPFADLKLLEHVLRLPLRHLVHRGWNKWPARAFLMQGLSADVRWRTDKEHFGWLLTERVMAESESVLEDSLTHPGKAAEFVDFPAVRAALRDPLRLASQTKYDIVTLVQWMRRIRGT